LRVVSPAGYREQCGIVILAARAPAALTDDPLKDEIAGSATKLKD
jgi:hypothetical protein